MAADTSLIDADQYRASAAPAPPSGEIDANQYRAPAKPGTKPTGASLMPEAVKQQGKGFAELGKQYYQATNRDFDAAKADLMKNLKPAEAQGPIGDALKSWDSLWDLMKMAGAPANAALDVMGDHIEKLVGDFGHLVEKGAASDVYDPAARRAGQSGQQYPKGIDWKVHAEDVNRAVATAQSLVKPALYAASYFVPGGKKAPELAKPEAKPGAAEATAPTPTPEAGAVAPETVKPRIRQVGVTDTGKPRVRVVQPEEARANTAEAVAEMHPPTVQATPGKPPQSEGAAYLRLYSEWLQPHQAIHNLMKSAYLSNMPMGAHDLLDTMIPAAKSDTYVQKFLMRLREHVDDVPVRIVDTVHDHLGQPMEMTGGVYRYKQHDVQVLHRQDNFGVPVQQTLDLLHELVHAATSQYIHTYEKTRGPADPVIKELIFLHEYAAQMLPSAAHHYGIEGGIHEFIAEAMTNPEFQRALAKVKLPAQPKGSYIRTAWDALADSIRRMLGIPTSERDETEFLHRVMNVGQRLMKEQKRIGTPWKDKETFGAQFTVSRDAVRKSASWIEQTIRAVNPEGLGKKAKQSAAVIAHRVAERIQRTNVYQLGSKERLRYWTSNPHLALPFLERLETGGTFTGPQAALAEKYRKWADNVYQRDTFVTGLRYEPEDNYIPHLFERPDSVRAYLAEKFGKGWGTPSFIKERSFKTINEAVQAGYKLKYTNPEEMMLARQYASDIAAMRVGILRDLHDYGLAIEKGKRDTAPIGYTPQRSPTGQWYFVHEQANAPLHNAFDSFSLWQDKTLLGDVFRGGMWLKNAIVPVHLALSGFHVLHVAHIDNAAAIARAFEPGSGGPIKRLGQVLSGIPPFSLYSTFVRNPLMGAHYVRVFDDAIAGHRLTEQDETALQYMLEGGYTPHMDAVYRNGAEKSMLQAWAPVVKGQVWKLPSALMTTLRRPIFEIWIPNLKTASYLNDVSSLLKANPELLDNPAARKLQLRRIQKSVDNRYGEMSYNNLFWTRWAKDLAVLNTLSLGWQLGFIREYGGGAMDLGQLTARTVAGQGVRALKEGALHRPLFVTAYTTTALAYGGLMTYAMTGVPPKDWMDYVYPRQADGSRVNTMFYTREIAGILKHMENQGVISGLSHLAMSKSSGWLGTLTEFFGGVTGVRPMDNFGREFTDPEAPLLKRTEQTLAHVLGELQPISTQNVEALYPGTARFTEHPGEYLKEKASAVAEAPGKAVMSLSGFTPAPKYVSESKTEAQIQDYYHRFVAPQETPYDQAEHSKEYTQLRKMYQAGDEGYDDALGAFIDRYKLSTKDVRRLEKNFNSELTPNQRLFMRLPPEQQRRVLLSAPPDERAMYLDHANKKVKEEFE